ncbi:MAG TPA: hypothetical protein VEA59_04050 [Patescibacteria group bacterium]|nr:hypothetical protein [Patescibacteria group bacterium]
MKKLTFTCVFSVMLLASTLVPRQSHAQFQEPLAMISANQQFYNSGDALAITLWAMKFEETLDFKVRFTRTYIPRYASNSGETESWFLGGQDPKILKLRTYERRVVYNILISDDFKQGEHDYKVELISAITGQVLQTAKVITFVDYSPEHGPTLPIEIFDAHIVRSPIFRGPTGGIGLKFLVIGKFPTDGLYGFIGAGTAGIGTFANEPYLISPEGATLVMECPCNQLAPNSKYQVKIVLMDKRGNSITVPITIKAGSVER